MSEKLQPQNRMKKLVCSPKPQVTAKTSTQAVRSTTSPALLQRAGVTPGSLTVGDFMEIQQTAGNRGVQRMLAGEAGLMSTTIQREPIRNHTGMPDNLKAGLENLSGLDLSGVRVHHNSSKPSQVGALAYTQGSNIYVAPGQEQHLPHEGWHTIQQMQGRVQANGDVAGLPLNDNPALETEADRMGLRAVQMKPLPGTNSGYKYTANGTVQRMIELNHPHQVIQRNAVEVLSTNVNTAWTGRNQFPAMRGTGTTRWVQDNDFIVGGAKGTFHHIVNKEKLRLCVKGYIWLKDKLKDKLDPDDYEQDGDELEPIKASMTGTKASIDNFFAEVGNPNGDSVRDFYWRQGNGFIGVRADLRNDNPAGTDNEGHRPVSFDNTDWVDALDWYTKLTALTASASGINTTTDTVKGTLDDIKAKLDAATTATQQVTKDGTPHRTDDAAEADNQDWKRKADAAEAWGNASKIYELK